jgi:hypothetical protein
VPSPSLDDIPRLLAAYDASRTAPRDDGATRALALRAAQRSLTSAHASGEPAKIESALRSLKLALDMQAQSTAEGEAQTITVIEAAVGDDPDEQRE